MSIDFGKENKFLQEHFGIRAAKQTELHIEIHSIIIFVTIVLDFKYNGCF
jgi:hypothetical protein